MIFIYVFNCIEHILFGFFCSDIEAMETASPFTNLRMPYPAGRTSFPEKRCPSPLNWMPPPATSYSFVKQRSRQKKEQIGRVAPAFHGKLHTAFVANTIAQFFFDTILRLVNSWLFFREPG